jgi:hypothetical protein
MTDENDGARPRQIFRSITGASVLILAASALLPRFASATRHVAQPAIDSAQPALNAEPDVTSVPRTVPIAGRVIDRKGQPVVGAKVYSKAGRMRIGTNVQVSESRKDIAHYEVVIAADPKGAKDLVLASMASASPTNRDLHDVATFTSSDGGNTWKLARVQKGQAENESYFDPHLAYGPDGSVYMVTMRNNPRKANAGNIERRFPRREIRQSSY